MPKRSPRHQLGDDVCPQDVRSDLRSADNQRLKTRGRRFRAYSSPQLRLGRLKDRLPRLGVSDAEKPRRTLPQFEGASARGSSPAGVSGWMARLRSRAPTLLAPHDQNPTSVAAAVAGLLRTRRTEERTHLLPAVLLLAVDDSLDLALAEKWPDISSVRRPSACTFSARLPSIVRTASLPRVSF